MVYTFDMSKEHIVGVYKQHSEQLAKALANMDEFHVQVYEVALQMREAFDAGKKVLVAGNGGSAAEVEHMSDEFVGRYKTNRIPYPVIALTSDGAVLTCIGNDFGYEQVFARQVEALGNEGDIFIGLSTSGNSPNILAAAEKAREKGMTVIGLTAGKGKLREMADYLIDPPTEFNPRAQELHLHAIHLLCEAFEPDNIGNL